MEFKDIIAIRGKGDLYKIIAKTPKGLVVESITDKKVKFKIQPDLHVLLLSDITIFATDNSDLFLKDVFIRIFEKDGKDISVNPKDDPKTLKEYFKEVAPNHDEERVYTSDMKKMVKWYGVISEFYPEVLENLKKETEEDDTDEKENTGSEKKGNEDVSKKAVTDKPAAKKVSKEKKDKPKSDRKPQVKKAATNKSTTSRNPATKKK